ncbi:MAG: hypothetical protein COV48_13755 [Elusimicrobia bacterium CG11_big_fil_rev_8_21_14_0_20_64_6]|nr:MAG: hypothetical protein COV48_13755 [Elusimicrobia bacterium CG11_big_fil_rev_8_21_14_0_20_64_6]
MDNKKKIGVGLVGLAALGAAAAAYLYRKGGEKDRAKIKGWGLKAKGELLENLESSKELSQERYHELVDKATKKYGHAKKATAPERKRLQKDLKSAWSKIAKELKS